MITAKNFSNLPIRVATTSGHSTTFAPGEERQIPAVLAVECAGHGLKVTGYDFGTGDEPQAKPTKGGKKSKPATDESLTVSTN